MGVNRGKQFESVVQQCFERVPEVSVTRIPDQTMGYKGATNPCDFLIYHKPYLYAIECKSTHSGTFSIYSPNPKKKYGGITNDQWKGLLEMSTVKGVHAGIMVWFIDKDETLFMSIQLLVRLRHAGRKSFHSYPDWLEFVEGKHDWEIVYGRKKRVLFDYDMERFLRDMET